MSGSALVIVNPTSAGGATGRNWPAIASDLARVFGPFQVAFTTGRRDAQRIAREAALAGHELLIACGGDGTISEVANGIIESGKDPELGVLPSGTGGDFRRSLGLPNRPADAARLLRDGVTRYIDVGLASYVSEAGTPERRYFVGVASFGMSGDVILRVKRSKSDWLAAIPGNWLGGKATFAKAMLETAFAAGAKEVDVELDDLGSKRVKVANFCIANARYFGGGMKVAPDAELDDGLFDVVEIGDLGALQILTKSPLLYMGKHLSIDGITDQRAARVRARPIRQTEVIPIEIDGELPGRLPAEFEILAGRLKVRCPRVEF